jgi:hypothetical protein
MEPLWSPVVATDGNPRQIGLLPKQLKQAKTVAVNCRRLPSEFHGQEGSTVRVPQMASAKHLRRDRPFSMGADSELPCPSLPTGIRASTPGGSRMAGPSIPN